MGTNLWCSSYGLHYSYCSSFCNTDHTYYYYTGDKYDVNTSIMRSNALAFRPAFSGPDSSIKYALDDVNISMMRLDAPAF